ADSCVKTVSGTQETSFSLGIMVRIAGLEPARLAALPPQSSVSANSTISATRRSLKYPAARTQGDFEMASALAGPKTQMVHPAGPGQTELPMLKTELDFDCSF